VNRPAHVDIEHHGMIALLHHPQLTAEMKSSIDREIFVRAERIRSGAFCGAGTEWEKRFQRIDRELRLRWAFPEGPGEIVYHDRVARGVPHPAAHWVVDRWVEQWQAWAPVLFICDTSVEPPAPLHINSAWWLMLKAADMQAADNAKRILDEKRAAAAARRAEIRKENDEKVRAAVDSLSSRQIKQFVEVEQAIQSGEKIEAHGSDERFLDHVWNNQKQGKIANVPTGRSINPGMHPRRYQRQKAEAVPCT
jgi:hypothetical protein